MQLHIKKVLIMISMVSSNFITVLFVLIRLTEINYFLIWNHFRPFLCSSLSQKVAGNPIFQGDFHLEFCDDVRQLLQAYFRDFAVERLDRPWQAFTASWSPNTVARNLGLNASYVSGEDFETAIKVLNQVVHKVHY